VNTGYILIACGFVGLAIAYNLWVRFRSKAQRPRSASSLRTWVTRELRRGDLRALSGAARGYCYDVDIKQAERLCARGFLGKGLMGQPRVTLKGRFALLLRSTIARDKSAAETA
jgi:hypothetical protein